MTLCSADPKSCARRRTIAFGALRIPTQMGLHQPPWDVIPKPPVFLFGVSSCFDPPPFDTQKCFVSDLWCCFETLFVPGPHDRQHGNI